VPAGSLSGRRHAREPGARLHPVDFDGLVEPEYRERVKAFVMDGRKGLGPDLHLHDVLMWD